MIRYYTFLFFDKNGECNASCQVSEHIERLVNLLKRDEGAEVEDAETVETTLPEMISTEEDEEDDEDLRIEEI